MPIAVVGVSHHTAPVEVRERMAFSDSDAARALLTLRARTGIEEAVLLSTCNRTEVYLYPVLEAECLEAAQRLFAEKAEGLERPADEYLFQREGESVVRHLFGVSAGLDSMVTGEAEIQGQVRDAYLRSAGDGREPALTGPVLNRLFQTALAVGGQIRAETSINEGTASVASVAVELARKIFGQLKEKRILILGAGATAELMVEALAREGVRGVLVANRTYSRAEELAERLEGRAIPIERLTEGLPRADIILASTAAPHPVLTKERFHEAFPNGRHRPLLIIDIAIPRDVEPRVGDADGVFLYNVDDLRKIVDEHVELRSEAIPAANRIIDERWREFRSWYASREVVPVIRRMREQAEVHRAAELERLFGSLDTLDPEERGRVEEFSRRLLNKLLHDPTVRLRKGMARGGGAELVDAVRFLYGIEDRQPSPPNTERERADREPRRQGERAPHPTRDPQHGVVE